MHGNDDGDLDDFWGKGPKRINVKKRASQDLLSSVVKTERQMMQQRQ